jgi:curved DNA-binding protein
MKDYYKTLGVDKKASAADIKKAFRTKAKKYHPDVNEGDAKAEERFKQANEAYAVLSDPEKRQQYDQFGSEGFRQRYSQEDIYRGSDIFSVLNDLFSGGGGRGGRGGGGGFESMFGSAFGGGGRPGGPGRQGGPGAGFDPFSGGGFGGFGGQPGPQPGQSYETDMVVSLDEAFVGGKRRLSLQAQGGHKINVEVTIPKGIKDGQKMRLAGKGAPSPNGGPSGDLLVTLKIAPHPQFRLEGKDLHTEAQIPVSTLALGGEAEVLTLTGEQRKLKLKAGTQCGSKLRFRGAGMGTAKGPAGDLYVTIRGSLPDPLTKEHKKLFEKLKELGG